jgi:hypothetical protein
MSHNGKNQHITLSSAGNAHLRRSNTASNFTIQLPHTVNLPPVSTYYEVGIVNLLLPARFFNVTPDSNTILVKKSKSSKQDPPQTYSVNSYEVGNVFQIPALLDHMSHREFARYFSTKITGGYGKDFEIRFVLNASDDPTEPKAELLFEIKNKSMIKLDEKDRAFWELLGVPRDRIGLNLTHSFAIKADDTNDEILRIPYHLHLTIKRFKTEIYGLKNIPQVAIDDEYTTIRLDPGIYEKEEKLIDHIIKKIDTSIIETSTQGNPSRMFSFILNQDNTLSIKILSSRYMLKFPDLLAETLGFPQNRWIRETENKSAYPVDLFFGLNSFFIYSDIVMPSITSDTLSPLLRVIAPEFSNKHRVKGYPINPVVYMPISRTSFNSITVFILGDLSKQIQFLPNVQTTIKLHIRVYKE